jgi:murein DD-endopeptidase MepM/ murein hydrolase activator NlpD
MSRALLAIAAALTVLLAMGTAVLADDNPLAQRAAKGIDPTFGDQETGRDEGDDEDSGDEENDSGNPDPVVEGGRGRRERGFSAGGGKPPEIDTDVSKEAFYDARRPAKLVFNVDFRDKDYFDDHKVAAKIDLEKSNKREEIESWKVDIDSDADHSVKWRGTKRGSDKPATPGKYRFDITPLVDGKVVKPRKSKSKPVATSEGFNFYTHIYPVNGHHKLGGKAGRFGAGRKGHEHQGQDVFAKCGVPLRAARGGKIQASKFQSSAGFYIVIDGEGTDVDYAYMHLKKRSPLRDGEKVKTGQYIGNVGDTGDAQGCHLHFEMWSGPGWYEGGKPFDPLPQMKGWDKFS